MRAARRVERAESAHRAEETEESAVARAHHHLAATMMTAIGTTIVIETGASVVIGTDLAAQTTATAR